MPKYTVTDPTTGKKVTLTGDTPPSEKELEDIFSTVHGDTTPAPIESNSGFDTKLAPAKEKQFQNWMSAESKKRGRDISQDLSDYDLRGYWQDIGSKEKNSQGHMPDTYKKPNHPTFSKESKYHGADLGDGKTAQGGVWQADSAFVPGPTNLDNHSIAGLQDYFQRVEPGVKLTLPIPGIPGIGGEKLAPPGPPVRPPDEPAPPPPEGDPSLGQQLFPNTLNPKAKTQEPVRDADGNITGYVPVEQGSAMDPVSDMVGYMARYVGAAVPSKSTRGTNADGSTKTFHQALANPKAGLGLALREHLADIVAEKIALKKTDRPLLLKFVDTAIEDLAAAGYAATTIAEDPSVILTGLASGAVKGLEHLAPRAKALVQATSKLPGASLERAAGDLTSVQAAAETQPALATDITDEVSRIRQANSQAHQAEGAADLAKHEAEVNRLTTGHEQATAAQDAAFVTETDAQKRGLQTGVAAQRPGSPLLNPSEVNPYQSGKNLEAAATAARKAVGDKFGKKLSEAFHQSGISMQQLPREGVKGGPARVGKPGEILSQNPLEDFIDESLNRAGYNPTVGYEGNEHVSQGAVKWLLDRKAMAAKQRTLGQVLKFRRNFQDQLFKDTSGPTPLFPRTGQGANDFRFLKSVYDESNNLIGDLPKKFLPEDKATAWSKAWGDLNKDFAEPIGILDDIAEGVGKFSDPEDFMKKMKDIGTDNFKAFNQAATKHPEMKPVVDEMRGMTFDNLLRLSLDPKDGNNFNPDRFVNLWNAEYRDNRTLMVEALGGERVGRINSAVEKYKLPAKPAPIPKPDLPAKPAALPKQEPAFPRLGGRQENPEVKTVLSTVSNIGNKPNVFALRELEFLDNVLGLKGKDRFTERALDAYAAKELGIGKDGIVPTRNLKHTGFATGSRVAGTATGASAGYLLGHFGFGNGPAGAAVGAWLGQGVGARTTSPSAAIAAYKAIGRLDRAAKSEKALQLLKAATKTRSAGAIASFEAQLERELTSPNLIPFRKVASADSAGADRQAAGD